VPLEELALSPTDGFDEELDACACPSLAVDARLRVHHHSEALGRFLPPLGGLLDVVDNHLVVRRSDLHQRLRGAVGRVLAGERAVEGLALERASGAPVTIRITRWPEMPIVARVAVKDPQTIRVDRSLIQDLFGLTRAEACVAALLCDGRALSEIAELTGVKLSTTQAHVKRVLAKCGVRRQSQLVALLLRSVATCHRVPPSRPDISGPADPRSGTMPRMGNDCGAPAN